MLYKGTVQQTNNAIIIRDLYSRCLKIFTWQTGVLKVMKKNQNDCQKCLHSLPGS